MFAFFKRGKSAGKNDDRPTAAERSRTTPNGKNNARPASVTGKPSTNEYDVTNDSKTTTTPRKDVVNLLLTDTDYDKKTGVGAIWDIMAGKKKKRSKKNISRAESCRELTPQRESNAGLQRAQSQLARSAEDVTAPTPACAPDENTPRTRVDAAQYVRQLVLQKYANKTPESRKQHVSLVYVPDEKEREKERESEKRRAEALLREIARSIDCTVDLINENQMGANDSKNESCRAERNLNEPVYESVKEKDDSIKAFKKDLEGELEKLIKRTTDKEESDTIKRKSNLKPPKSDTEGCSDDDRSECGKKKVTFTKHIQFDDGDQQTDEEVDSSFESISSEEEDLEVPDNDELLGGVVVARNEDVHAENKTESPVVVEQNEKDEPKVEEEELKRISSDNSDSGFIEISEKQNSEELSYNKTSEVSDSESEVSESGTEEEDAVIEEEEEEEEGIVANVFESNDKRKGELKDLVNENGKFQSQLEQIAELSDSRTAEACRLKDAIARCRKEIEEKDSEIERLKCELAAAYKESELIRQRSRSLEEDLAAAKACSAELAEKFGQRNEETVRELNKQLEEALSRTTALEARVEVLLRDKERLEDERSQQEKSAREAIAAAEANTLKWRTMHESARTQAAARAEKMLVDCEWKMRELEKKARDADKQRIELSKTLEQVRAEKSQPSASHVAELQQLRGLASEQQRSVQALTTQLQRVETREEALKLEVHRLKDVLERETRNAREKEDRHLQTLERLEANHTKALDSQRAEFTAAAASTRAALERVYAEKTRQALAQLRAEAERDAKNADRKLREVTTRYENLKQELAAKQAHYEKSINDAHSKADWELLQLRHLLDKADITYANNIEQANERFEREKEELIEEWSAKLKEAEEQASSNAKEARALLESTRTKLIAEKNEQLHKLKEQHKLEMDEQWEQFMTDKENCLARMKAECRQEGEEERVKREKDLLEEIAELKSQIQDKTIDFDNLAVKAAACGRTLAVTEQELKEALEREREMREKRSEDAVKLKQVERAGKEQIEHLTRKCACLRKLFDDMRARLSTRERDAEQEAKAREKEIHHLRGEVARLTRILLEQGSPSLGDRTQADGCDSTQMNEFFPKAESLACDAQQNAPRRKSATLKTPEPARKLPKPADGVRTRLNLPELAPIPPERPPTTFDDHNGRRRSKSVDLPAVQVPVRIKQLEEMRNQ